MSIRIYKPTSAGRRNSSVNVYEDITSTTPEKSLLRPLKKTGGRNNQGFITSRHRGGGNKRMYRIIDFHRNKDSQSCEVDSVQYDPNRSCNIALVKYEDGEKRYILCPLGLKVGQKLYSGEAAEPRGLKFEGSEGWILFDVVFDHEVAELFLTLLVFSLGLIRLPTGLGQLRALGCGAGHWCVPF